MHEQMKRLYEAAKVLKHVYGQSELARLFNVSPQTIHNWQARGISKQGMLKAQEMVGCSASWLETGMGQMSLIQASSIMVGNNIQIPLITSEQAARFSRTSRNSALLQEPRAWLFTQLSLSARSFAMETSGSAMAPEFEEGDWIIVDPMVGRFCRGKIWNERYGHFEEVPSARAGCFAQDAFRTRSLK